MTASALTREAILAMPAGPEMDRAIAERVMGWTDLQLVQGSGGLAHWFGKPPGAKALAPITNTLGTSQLCRYLFTALVLGSLPMIAPPVLWVL